MKRLLAVLLALTLMLSLVACAAPAEEVTTEPEDTSTTPEQVVDTQGATENLGWEFQQEEYKLACYWPAPDTYFDSYVKKGMEQFNADYSQDVEWMVGTDWTQDVENQSVEAMAAQGYDLFYIFGADSTGANALYKELYDAGFEVVNYAGAVADPQESALTLASNVYQMGYDSTKLLIEYMGGEGKIINVLENLNDVNTQKRQQGVEDAVAEHPGVEIIQTVADIATVDAGFEKISDALAANMDADAIVATGGTASIALANAMGDYYGTNPDAKHIFAGTVDQSNEVMNAIKEGHIDHTLAQNGWGQGYISPLILMYLKDGWEPITWGEHIDSGSLVITVENVDTWQQDIEKLTMDIIASIETDILMQP